MRVVVVGATGNVGLSLVGALSSDPGVDEIVGVARRLPDITLPKVRWHAADVTSSPLDVVAGADAVVHLAWKIQPQHREAVMLMTNVVGTRRLVDAIVRHRVPALVYASSVGAYAHGPKDWRVDESWPASGIPSSSYSRHKATVEAMLDDVEAAYPQLRIARLRTSLVFQRPAAASINRLFVSPLAPRRLPDRLRIVPRTPRLEFQATHTSDVAEAYRLAIHADAHGAFNIAAEPALTPALMAETLDARVLPVPAWVLRAGAAATWHLRLQRSERGWVDMALGTPLMSTTRARTELGWAETRTATDALAEVFGGLGDGAGGPTPHLRPRRGGPVDAPATAGPATSPSTLL
jgi:nucleoside-diphosphate-sugar epimerase